MRNNYEVHADVVVAEVQRRSGVVLYFLIDADKLESLPPDGMFYINNKNYVMLPRYVNGRVKNPALLHRLIMNAPDDLIVDHIFADRLDNRQSQLRLATRSQNGFNRQGIGGVYPHNRTNPWVAKLRFDGCVRTLGYFKKFSAAADAVCTKLRCIDPIAADNRYAAFLNDPRYTLS